MRNLRMNKLTFTISAAVVSSLFTIGTASADFTGMQYEAVENGMSGLTTWRVYAGVDAGGELDAVYGDESNMLSVSSDSGFSQNAFGSWGTPNAALFVVFPSLEFDSFVTIGLLDDAGDNMLSIGIDYAAFEAGGSISTDNGTWFATPADAQVNEVNGRVLVGQFTVGDSDHVFGSMNFQGKNADGSNWTADGELFDTAPAPGALALLGLAGIAARRRRK
jgi:MYXO-CTERM domain-containing protein